MERKAVIEPMFPHTSLPLECHRSRGFIVDDRPLFLNQDVPSKGGYNLFRTFAEVYLDMIAKAADEELVSRRTFISVKRRLMDEFLVQWYYKTMVAPNDFTYDLNGITDPAIILQTEASVNQFQEIE